MFIAMNRFRIGKGYEEGFEKVWRERDSYLSEVPGFRSFARGRRLGRQLAPGSAAFLIPSGTLARTDGSSAGS